MRQRAILFLFLCFALILGGQRHASAQSIQQAVNQDDFGTVQRLLQNNPALVNSRQTAADHLEDWSIGCTPLHRAARRGNLNIVKLLVKAGADVNALRPTRETPLAEAAATGHLDVVKFLFQSGGQVNSKNSTDGNSPLLWAAERNYADVVRFLCQNGADINYQRADGMSAVHLAVQGAYFDVIHALIENHADLNLKRSDGFAPIHLGAAMNRWGEAELLVEGGADIDLVDTRGDTALFEAIRSSKIEPLKSLVVMGANLEAKNSAGQTPLEAAQAKHFGEAVNFITQYQLAVDLRKRHEVTLKDSTLNLRTGYCAWDKSKTETTVVYKNAFDTNAVTGEWTARKSAGADSFAPLHISVSPVGDVRYLGEFGNQEVRLVLLLLPPHQSVSITFDLVLVKTWMGDHWWSGPSLWSLGLVDGETLLRTSFMNANRPGHKLQSYPANFPGGHNDPYTGAADKNTLGYRDGETPSDAIYRISYTFDNSASALEFNFAASGLQALDKAGWGLKNVEVSVGNPALIAVIPPPSKPDSIAVTNPNPATVAPKSTASGTNGTTTNGTTSSRTASGTKGIASGTKATTTSGSKATASTSKTTTASKTATSTPKTTTRATVHKPTKKTKVATTKKKPTKPTSTASGTTLHPKTQPLTP